jgi:outer membrane receptor for ferrienterochelin and colicins
MDVPHYAGVADAPRLERTPSFVTLDAGVSRELGAWNGRTVTLMLNGRNLTNAYQKDVDQGPLRDAAYVYGPRFPRSSRRTSSGVISRRSSIRSTSLTCRAGSGLPLH